MKKINHLPDDVQILIFLYWLQASLLGPSTRKAIANTGSDYFEYKTLRKKWIQPLNPKRIAKMNILFSEMPKPTHIQFRIPNGHQVVMSVLRLYSQSNPAIPAYVQKCVSTIGSNDIAIWVIHHYTGPRIFRSPNVQAFVYDIESNTWNQ